MQVTPRDPRCPILPKKSGKKLECERKTETQHSIRRSPAQRSPEHSLQPTRPARRATETRGLGRLSSLDAEQPTTGLLPYGVDRFAIPARDGCVGLDWVDGGRADQQYPQEENGPVGAIVDVCGRV